MNTDKAVDSIDYEELPENVDEFIMIYDVCIFASSVKIVSDSFARVDLALVSAWGVGRASVGSK